MFVVQSRLFRTSRFSVLFNRICAKDWSGTIVRNRKAKTSTASTAIIIIIITTTTIINTVITVFEVVKNTGIITVLFS